MNTSDRWYTKRQGSDYLQISPRQLQRAMSQGKLRFTRVGRLVRFRREWLDALALGLPARLSKADQKQLRQLHSEGTDHARG